jgi:hypothetical protein
VLIATEADGTLIGHFGLKPDNLGWSARLGMVV